MSPDIKLLSFADFLSGKFVSDLNIDYVLYMNNLSQTTIDVSYIPIDKSRGFRHIFLVMAIDFAHEVHVMKIGIVLFHVPTIRLVRHRHCRHHFEQPMSTIC